MSVNSRQTKRSQGTPQVPGDAIVLKRFFCRRSKRIAFLESDFFLRFYTQIFNFRDSHMTTFWHPSRAYICLVRLSRLAKGTLQFRLSFGTIGLG